MIDFKTYVKISDEDFQRAAYIIAEMVEMQDDMLIEGEILDEEVLQKIKDKVMGTLDKLGIKVHKSKGLIDHASEYGRAMLDMLVAAVKGDMATVKKIANTEISHEDLKNMIHKLDLAVLTVVAPILHAIEAATGWELKFNDPNTKAQTVHTYRDAIAFMKKKTTTMFDGKRAKKILNRLANIEKVLSPQFLNA